MNPQGKSSFQEALDLAERLGLYDIDQQLRLTAKAAGNTRSLAERLRADFTARVQAYASTMQTTGFLPGPAPILSNGLFTLGTTSGIPFRLTPPELLRHIIVAGPSGSGKTTLLQPLGLQVRSAGGHLIIADYKNDLSWLAATDNDFLILHPDAPLNLLDHPAYVRRDEYITMLLSILTRSYYGGEHLRQVAHDTLWETYRRYDHPSINDWHHVTKERQTPKETYQRRDALNGLIMRQNRFIEQLPGMARNRIGIPHQALWERSLYLGALHQNDTNEFLTAWTVNSYYLWARAHQARNAMRYLILLDEGLLTFGEGNRIDGPVLLPLVPLLREYGAALAIATAHHGAIHETIRANVYTTVILPLANATDLAPAARSLGITQESAAHLLHLQPGQAVVKTGKWRSPILLEFPPLPYEKTITEEQWRAAIQRTNQLAPAAPTVTTPDSSKTPAPPEPATKPVALSVAEEALLRTIAKETVMTVSQAYKAAGLPPQVGDRAMKKLVLLDFVERDKILVRKGRGGTAIGLRPTHRAYDRINTKPAHGTRGGDSVQHQWLVTRIAKHLPGCMVEPTLGDHGDGGKSIDIVFRITPENTAHWQRMTSTFQHLVDDIINPKEGDLVGIEVETTPANAASNATKNLAVGIAFNITATMPDTIEATTRSLRKAIPTDAQRRVVVADALDLLEALKG